MQQAEIRHTAHVDSEELGTEKQLRESMYSAEVEALHKEKMGHIAIRGIPAYVVYNMNN